MAKTLKHFNLSIEITPLEQREFEYFKNYKQGMDGNLMVYDIGGEISLNINGIQIKKLRFDQKREDRTIFDWYTSFFWFTTNILSHVPLNLPVKGETEDFSLEILNVRFPKFNINFVQKSLIDDKRYLNLSVDYFDFKSEIKNAQKKIMKYLEEIGNPNIFQFHLNFKRMMDGWKLIQSDFFEEFPQHTIDQLQKEENSDNVVIKELVKTRLNQLHLKSVNP